ncbi:hypothetical protein P20495_3339 [Pseudoalteromonas sp. BSi20495]|nr:hypothetical protein P20495_3339 [Pseudoalteromonas sp. BSi20495]
MPITIPDTPHSGGCGVYSDYLIIISGLLTPILAVKSPLF